MIEKLQKDPLTGLYNRHAFYPKFIQNLDRLQKENRPYAILMIDIDNFKKINDSYGHLAGDQVLMKASEILNHQEIYNSMSCRYGGEEFLVFLQDATFKEAKIFANKILKSFETCIHYDEVDILMTASVGMIYSDSLNIDYQTLIMKADKKMYQAKKNGKNQMTYEIIK